MARKKPKAIDLARKAALQGDVDAALPMLRECAREGDDSACASLAEVLAFEGGWQECIANAARLIANPFAASTANVFNDMVRLLGRAGRETGSWDAVALAAAEARLRVEQRLCANEMKYPEEKVRAERTRLSGILGRLEEYARSRGAPPHELVQIFSPGSAASVPDEAGYRVAVESNKKKPPARMLSLAIAFKMDAEAIRICPAVGDFFFDDAVFIAGALVRQKAEKAWEVVAGNVAKWSPVDAVQVAPVVLLTDEHLRQITTPDRARFVVRLPRAGESRPEKKP